MHGGTKDGIHKHFACWTEADPWTSFNATFGLDLSIHVALATQPQLTYGHPAVDDDDVGGSLGRGRLLRDALDAQQPRQVHALLVRERTRPFPTITLHTIEAVQSTLLVPSLAQ